MIPRVIHYCWFGKKKKPKLVIDCIESWRKYCPDFKIVEWNETNTSFHHPFVQKVKELKKWAFISDYVRLEVLLKHGGIYLDTDMMLVKGLEALLNHKCFFGAEEESIISAGIIGSEKNHFLIENLLKEYDTIQIKNNFNEIAIPLIITSKVEEISGNKICIKNVTKLQNVVIYPKNYFYPFPNKEKAKIKQYLTYRKQETIAIHLWNASWVDYNEFDYILQRQYIKALFKILNTIFIKQDFNAYYFKRIFNHLFK